MGRPIDEEELGMGMETVSLAPSWHESFSGMLQRLTNQRTSLMRELIEKEKEITAIEKILGR